MKKLPSIVLTISLAGFLAVSYIPSFLHLDNRAVTVPFRGLVLLILIVTLAALWKHAAIKMTPTTALAAFFLTIYSLRVIYDELFLQVRLEAEPWEILLYLFGMCIPAFVVFYLIRDIYSYRKALPWTLLIMGACCILSAYTTTARDIVRHGRYTGNDLVSHIEYGHMGVTTIILGLFVFASIGKKYSWWFRILSLCMIAAGAFAVFSSASRGALVAGVILISLVLVLAMWRGSKTLTLSLVTTAVLMAGLALNYLKDRGVNLDPLLMVQGYTANNQSTFLREVMYHDAWEQYLANPVLGSSFVEENSRLYPHNIIIESFMATGTFGGAAFVSLILISLWRSVKIIRRAPEMAWVPICYMQYLLGAMFSGGIYANVLLWGMLGVVLGVDIPDDYSLVVRTVFRPHYAGGPQTHGVGQAAR